CATANAAKLFGGDTGAQIGKIEKGNFADIVILRSNPLDDIVHASDIDTVIKNGAVYPADSSLHCWSAGKSYTRLSVRPRCPGERMRLACWFSRLDETGFS